MDADGTALGTIFNKTGGVYAHAQAYSQAEMQALLDHTRQKAAELADGIREGEISVSPAEIKGWTACQWCEYSAVCGFDPTLPHCNKRVLPTLNRQELLDMLANDTGESPEDPKNE